MQGSALSTVQPAEKADAPAMVFHLPHGLPANALASSLCGCVFCVSCRQLLAAEKRGRAQKEQIASRGGLLSSRRICSGQAQATSTLLHLPAFLNPHLSWGQSPAWMECLFFFLPLCGDFPGQTWFDKRPPKRCCNSLKSWGGGGVEGVCVSNHKPSRLKLLSILASWNRSLRRRKEATKPSRVRKECLRGQGRAAAETLDLESSWIGMSSSSLFLTVCGLINI